MKKPREKALRYKTSRVSYITNYFLTILVAILFFIIQPYLANDLWSTIALSAVLVVISFLILEPEWEIVLREYNITNTEVTKVEGIISKKIVSIPHLNIADITFTKSVVGRIFDFGNVKVRGVKDTIEIKGVRDPEVIYRIIKNKIALTTKPKVAKKQKK